MTELESQYRVWTDLMDRKASGEKLSPEELATCERLGRDNPLCTREQALLEELSDFEAAPDAASSALVEATLERMAREAQRAEQKELQALKHPGRATRLWWGLGVAALVALGTAFALLPRPQDAPSAKTQPPKPSSRVELVYSAGEVAIDGKPAQGTVLLGEGARVSVTRGSACLAMDPDIDLCLAEDSELVLSRVHSPWRRLDLTRGKVGVQLQPQPDGARLSIVAENVWSTAIGTAFTVARSDDRAVRTTVMQGKVRVGSDGGEEHVVAAHERAEVRGGNAAVTALGRSDEAPEWALLGPAELWRDPVSASLVVKGLPTGVEQVLDGQRIGTAPLSTLVPVGSHTLQVRVEGQVLATRALLAKAGQATVLTFSASDLTPAEPESAERVVSARARRPAASSEGASDMLGEARRLLRNAQFGAAAREYQALRAAHPDSAEAHAVLVSLAELELEQLGQPERALIDLERYLVVGGPLSEEARYLRVRAMRALGQHDGEVHAIEELLDAHPNSLRTAALRRRLSELQR